MLKRLGHCLFAALVALDIVTCTLWLMALYPFGLADRPTGRVPISAYVGRAARNGMPWGLRAAAAIDWLMGRWDGPDHCCRSCDFYGPVMGE